MSRLRIALVNLTPVYREIDRNLGLIERTARDLSPSRVDLACFPEMCLTGYSNSTDVAQIAQSENGKAVKELACIARTTGIALAAGMPELGSTRRSIYISHFFCSPEGRIFCYRKTHLSKRERDAFSPGEQLGVVRWRSSTLAMQLCFDAHFPEFSLAQAWAGAQVILLCSASPMGPAAELRRRWLRFLPARAYDSGCYLLTCNQHGRAPFGTLFPGMAMAFNPDGELIAESREGNRPLIVDLDLEAVAEARKKRAFMRFRRPDIYRLSGFKNRERL